MVAFSGGKGIRGPQSTGILCGRKDLIEAAVLNSSPNYRCIGRPMKVCKEEIVGLITALELFVNQDHEAVWASWKDKAEIIVKMFSKSATVETRQDRRITSHQFIWDISQSDAMP